MRIEKINENQIRCFLTKEDLEARNLKLSELAYGSDKAKELFRELMRWAFYKFNFDAENIPLMIEAVPLSADSILLIVSKVAYPDEFDSRFSEFTEGAGGGFDWEDDDDFEDPSSLFSPYQGAPRFNSVSDKIESAHDVLRQYRENAAALAAAEAAVDALAQGAIKAAGKERAIGDVPKASVSPLLKGMGENGAVLPPAVETEEILPGAPVPAKSPEEEDILPFATDEGSVTEKTAAEDSSKKPASTQSGNDTPVSKQSMTAMTPQAFAAALSGALNAVRNGGSSGNYARMFRFDSLDDVITAARIIAPCYKGVNYLYKDAEGRFHLIVTMANEDPVVYNKVVNMLTEFGSREPLSHETTSFMDEHENIVLKENALQRLAGLIYIEKESEDNG